MHPNVKEALQTTHAKIVFVVNILTKFGLTHQYVASDFVAKLEEIIGKQVEVGYIVHNSRKPEEKVLQLYGKQKAWYVEIDNKLPFWENRAVHATNLLDATGDIVCHDSRKLAVLLEKIMA